MNDCFNLRRNCIFGIRFGLYLGFGLSDFLRNSRFGFSNFLRNRNFSLGDFFRNGDFSFCDFFRNWDFSLGDFFRNGDFSFCDFFRNGDFSFCDFFRNGDFSFCDFFRNGGFGFRLIFLGKERFRFFHGHLCMLSSRLRAFSDRNNRFTRFYERFGRCRLHLLIRHLVRNPCDGRLRTVTGNFRSTVRKLARKHDRGQLIASVERMNTEEPQRTRQHDPL